MIANQTFHCFILMSSRNLANLCVISLRYFAILNFLYRKVTQRDDAKVRKGILMFSACTFVFKQSKIFAVAFFFQFSDRNKPHRRRIHTITHSGFGRTVVENMSEMRIGVFGANFGAAHPEFAIGFLDKVFRFQRFIKLAQPQLESNFSFDENSGSPETTSTYKPSSWLSQYSLRCGGSVPSFCVTSYCIGVNFARNSSSDGFV